MPPESRPADEVFDEGEQHRTVEDGQLQAAANVFIDRAGEMYPREDAVGILVDELSVDKQDARRILSLLVGDDVDPCVQVTTPTGREVGVGEYVEGDIWYGYRNFDDAMGSSRRVVCARCVETCTFDHEVSYAQAGSGSHADDPDASYETLAKTIHRHFENEHDVAPSSVEVGASLVSSSTAGGNQVWHQGNVSGGSNISIGTQQVSVSPQGSGSGLDADTVDGSDAGDLGGGSPTKIWNRKMAFSTTYSLQVVSGPSYTASYSRYYLDVGIGVTTITGSGAFGFGFENLTGPGQVTIYGQKNGSTVASTVVTDPNGLGFTAVGAFSYTGGDYFTWVMHATQSGSHTAGSLKLYRYYD